MENLIVLAIVWLLFLFFVQSRRNYPALIFSFLVGVYEFPGLALFYVNLDIPEIKSAQFLFGAVADTATAELHVYSLAIFFGTFFFALMFASGGRQVFDRDVYTGQSNNVMAREFPFVVFVLSVVVLLIGIVSVIRGEGPQRLEDYVRGESEGLRVFGYGIVLMPVLGSMTIAFLVRKKPKFVVGMSLCAMPLLYEIFLAGRRQYFLPIFILLLMWPLYGLKKGKSWPYLGLFAAAILLFYGLQYSLRQNLSGEEAVFNNSVVSGSVAPQLGEFISIGATSLSSYSVVEKSGLTYGQQFLVTFFNAIPLAKLGNMLFPEIQSRFDDKVHAVAPFGGLSMIAESYLSFGMWGVAALGLMLGWLSKKINESFKKFYGDRQFNSRNIWAISVGAVLLAKYRSGLSDAFIGFTTVSLLFFAIYLIAIVLTDIVHPVAERRRHPSQGEFTRG